jgi:hypothetical protein
MEPGLTGTVLMVSVTVSKKNFLLFTYLICEEINGQVGSYLVKRVEKYSVPEVVHQYQSHILVKKGEE